MDHVNVTVESVPFVLTIDDAGRVLRCSRPEINRKLSRGDIKAVKDGRKTLILGESIAAYIGRCRAATFKPSARAA